MAVVNQGAIRLMIYCAAKQVLMRSVGYVWRVHSCFSGTLPPQRAYGIERSRFFGIQEFVGAMSLMRGS